MLHVILPTSHIPNAHIQQFQSWVVSASEHTPSESALTTDEEANHAKQTKALALNSNLGFDYVEPVDSASSMSTPPPSSLPDDPFASDNLGETVIRLDKVCLYMNHAHMYSVCMSICWQTVAMY